MKSNWLVCMALWQASDALDQMLCSLKLKDTAKIARLYQEALVVRIYVD